MEKKTSQTSPEGFPDSRQKGKATAAFKLGAVSLAFLVIGYQVALFVHSAAVTRIISNRDAPDTVFVVDKALAVRLMAEDALDANASVSGAPTVSVGRRAGESSEQPSSGVGRKMELRRSAAGSGQKKIYNRYAERTVETFSFNPNTVSVGDLVRLGFSEKQAASIDNYRRKGGRFHRKEDFASSYVVADSVFKRLEPHIHIPQTDINSADSAAFDALPGIGPYYAAKMVSYRTELGGYSYKEQLMDIWRFDEEKFNGLKDLITVDTTLYPPFALWEAAESELAAHPYIGKYAAHAVVLFRENSSLSQLSVEALCRAGVLTSAQSSSLARCRIAPPRK